MKYKVGDVLKYAGFVYHEQNGIRELIASTVVVKEIIDNKTIKVDCYSYSNNKQYVLNEYDDWDISIDYSDFIFSLTDKNIEELMSI